MDDILELLAPYISDRLGNVFEKSEEYQNAVAKDVFCKPFLHKIAKSFCRLLHTHFVGNCKASAGS